MQNNFNLVIQDDTHKIDISNRYYEVFLSTKNQKATFELSKNDENAIKDYILKNNFLLDAKNQSFFSINKELPISMTDITILNGQSSITYSYCSPCYYPFNYWKVKKIQKLVKMVEEICNKDVNVQKLPASNFYLE